MLRFSHPEQQLECVGNCSRRVSGYPRESHAGTTTRGQLGAEFLGTLWLVFGGCGSAVLAAKFLSPAPDPVQLGIGFLGVSLAFGLTVLTGAFAFGHVSGGISTLRCRWAWPSPSGSPGRTCRHT